MTKLDEAVEAAVEQLMGVDGEHLLPTQTALTTGSVKASIQAAVRVLAPPPDTDNSFDPWEDGWNACLASLKENTWIEE